MWTMSFTRILKHIVKKCNQSVSNLLWFHDIELQCLIKGNESVGIYQSFEILITYSFGYRFYLMDLEGLGHLGKPDKCIQTFSQFGG